MKRSRSHVEEASVPQQSRPTKKSRVGSRRNLLDLSDEILLRILSFLPIQHLITVERVSSQLKQLARDGEVWKVKYLDRWVSPRARRLPPHVRPSKSSKLVNWLDQGQKLREGRLVGWKHQYKLRNNWENGSAKFYEVELAKPPTPPVIAKVHCGLVFTVDSRSGLRIWSQAAPAKELVLRHSFNHHAAPASIAIDGDRQCMIIAVGFSDGSTRLYSLQQQVELAEMTTHRENDEEGPVSAIALAIPYLATMTGNRHTRLYHLQQQNTDLAPKVLTAVASLHANSTLQAASLSLRQTQNIVIATISYAFPRINDGWCLGLQEMRFSKDDRSGDSRITSTIDSPLEARYIGSRRWKVVSRSASSTPVASPLAAQPYLKLPPLSISYAHPYLLASLQDNSLMSYIVTSDDERLEINSGKRLYGHTSSANAEVSNRGKAVSVSIKGNDIRVWELEDVLTTAGRGRPSTQIKAQHAALDVAAAVARRGNGLGLALSEMKKELALTKRSIGFDDEQVVILGDRCDTQILACYDFT